MLDPSYPNNAYCLGRLFAVLEKLQADAIGSPGSTITDRFYGAASATPAAVFASLLRKAQHHIAKLGGAAGGDVDDESHGLLFPRVAMTALIASSGITPCRTMPRPGDPPGAAARRSAR